jgi:hypothetical protein
MAIGFRSGGSVTSGVNPFRASVYFS